MKLIFLYGPPGVGKLTVAEALEKLVGYRVFHNSLTVDLVESLFPFGSPLFQKYNQKFRCELFTAAAKEGIAGVIFTYVYAYPEDNANVRKYIQCIKKGGGTVHFVQLRCTKKENLKRVKGASRENFRKIKSRTKLEWVLNKYDLKTPIPFVKSLKINNTNVTPKRVAERIISHYKLNLRKK